MKWIDITQHRPVFGQVVLARIYKPEPYRETFNYPAEVTTRTPDVPVARILNEYVLGVVKWSDNSILTITHWLPIPPIPTDDKDEFDTIAAEIARADPDIIWKCRDAERGLADRFPNFTWRVIPVAFPFDTLLRIRASIEINGEDLTVFYDLPHQMIRDSSFDWLGMVGHRIAYSIAEKLVKPAKDSNHA